MENTLTFLLKKSSKMNKWIVPALLFIGFLAVLLLNPIVKSTHKITEKPIVILAQDISESIIDSSFLTEISKQLSDFEVHKFSFADKVHEGFKTNNTGLLTNYSNLFEDFLFSNILFVLFYGRPILQKKMVLINVCCHIIRPKSLLKHTQSYQSIFQIFFSYKFKFSA